MAHRQLSRRDRELIEHYLEHGRKPAFIAQALGRSRSTICDEIKRNGTSLGYKAEFADYHYKARRGRANQLKQKIPEGSELALYIFKKLRNRWSPEDISASLKRHEQFEYVSAKTIYKFIEDKHPEFTQYLLLKSRPKRKYKNGKRGCISNRTWIDARPKEVNERKEVGHWENDTIVSQCKRQAIATSAERVSGFLLAGKMTLRDAYSLNAALIGEFETLSKKARKTFTNDSGPEFAEHETLETLLKMKVYFAHPYHSWERPVNENTNRQLRRFFPKGTYFEEIEDWELDWAVKLINNKPRKRLNYHTPAEVFHSLIN